MRLRLLAAAVILTSGLFAADPGLVSLAMPNSEILAGVNVSSAALSPLGQFAWARSAQIPNVDVQKFIDATGFDPRRDLREIFGCMRRESGDKPGMRGFVAAAWNFRYSAFAGIRR